MFGFLSNPFRAAPGSVLRGGRVYLRPPCPDDWSAWAELRGESRAFLTPWEPSWPVDALTQRAFRRRLRRHGEEARGGTGLAFLIFRHDDDMLVGGITLSNIRYGVGRTCSVGYWTGAPHARQGYMFDALTRLSRHVFEDLKLHRLEAACVPTNTPSRRLLGKAGFTEEGFARQYLCIDGRWQDHVLFGLLETDPLPAVDAEE